MTSLAQWIRKIDEANDAVFHCVAQLDKGVPAAQHQTVDDLLYESIHKNSPIFDRRSNQPGKLKNSAARGFYQFLSKKPATVKTGTVEWPR